MLLQNNIDLKYSENYILSIRLTPNGFYFYIHHQTDQDTFFQKEYCLIDNLTYLENLDQFIFDSPYFHNNFSRVDIITVSDKFTLIPDKFYNKSFEKNVFDFNFHKKDLQIFSNPIQQQNCHLIGGIDKDIFSLLNRFFINPNFKHHFALLIPFFYQKHDKEKSAMYVNINDNNIIDIIAFKRVKLQLAKAHYVRNSLETNYFIQKTWEVLQTENLFFTGNISFLENEYESLRRLITKPKFLNKRHKGNNIVIDKTPTEILFQLCES